ncbi:MAG TPA: DUF58 domain-containing protein [Clostridia bacterium]|nr:DUF58 domain-containing protein [Clostridia bacterium]
MEFADYREYTPGDDIRLMDWKVVARTDRHYVRLYDAERNLLTYLIVDKSGSMEYKGAVRHTASKLEHAARLAAALAYLVVREGDEVGLSLADSRLHSHLPPSSSWAQLQRILDRLEQTAAEGTTDLHACLQQVFSRVRRRGVLVIFSDFLDASEDLWKSIDLFRKSRFDVILFHVTHPEELDLPDLLAARFVESEGGRGQFNVEPGSVRNLYQKRMERFIAEIKAGARARGCDWFLANTAEDPCVFLRNCFLQRDG